MAQEMMQATLLLGSATATAGRIHIYRYIDRITDRCGGRWRQIEAGDK